MATNKCSECDCDTHFAFRTLRLGGPPLCFTCWAYHYGEYTCSLCRKGCYDEDWNNHLQQYVCGHCRVEAKSKTEEATR